MKDQQEDKPELNQVKEGESENGGAQTNDAPTPCPEGHHRNDKGDCVKDGGNDTHPKPPVP